MFLIHRIRLPALNFKYQVKEHIRSVNIERIDDLLLIFLICCWNEKCWSILKYCLFALLQTSTHAINWSHCQPNSTLNCTGELYLFYYNLSRIIWPHICVYASFLSLCCTVPLLSEAFDLLLQSLYWAWWLRFVDSELFIDNVHFFLPGSMKM